MLLRTVVLLVYIYEMVIMLKGPLVYCALLFIIDFYLTDSSIYVYMSDLVGRQIAETYIKILLEIANVFH
jgi:hypothetical protein